MTEDHTILDFSSCPKQQIHAKTCTSLLESTQNIIFDILQLTLVVCAHQKRSESSHRIITLVYFMFFVSLVQIKTLRNALLQPDVSISSSLTVLHDNVFMQICSHQPVQIHAYSRLCIDFVCNLLMRIIKFTFGVHTPFVWSYKIWVCAHHTLCGFLWNPSALTDQNLQTFCK